MEKKNVGFGRETLRSGGYLVASRRQNKNRPMLATALREGFQLCRNDIELVLIYDASSGKFFWKVPPRRGVSVGSEAGSVSHGYVEIVLYGVRCRSHWLVWFMENGTWPLDFTLDHINRNRSDNRISNLRQCTRISNSVNTTRKDATGLRGVSWHNASGLWRARVRVGGVERCSYHSSPEKAHQAYLKSMDEIHPGFLPQSERQRVRG